MASRVIHIILDPRGYMAELTEPIPHVELVITLGRPTSQLMQIEDYLECVTIETDCTFT